MSEPGNQSNQLGRDTHRSRHVDVQALEVDELEIPPLTPEQIRQGVEEELREEVRKMRLAGRKDLLEPADGSGPIFPTDLELKRILARHCEHMAGYDPEVALAYVERLQRDVMIDRLTDIPNRRQYDRDMATRFSGAERKKRKEQEPEPFAMCMIDIDYFHQVNTAVGHPIGDIFLQQTVRIIKEQLKRASDQLYRYGGEEIAVILPETTKEQASIVMERVRSAIEQELVPAVLDNAPNDQQDLIRAQLQSANLIPTTVSIGVSEYRSEHQKPLDLFTEADSALYRAKKGTGEDDPNKRNQVRQYDSSIEIIDRPPEEGCKQESASVQRLSPKEQVFEDILADYLQRVQDLHTLRDEAGGVFYPIDYIEGLEYILSKSHYIQYLRENPTAAQDLQLIAAGMERLQQDARIDALTRLPNRRAFEEVFSQKLSEVSRRATREARTSVEEEVKRPRSLTVLLFDIDKFKRLNDTCGHHVGDICLAAIGDVLNGYQEERVIDNRPCMVHVPGIVRNNEFAARFDGEEFAVIIETDDPEEVKLAAHRIGRAITDLVFNHRPAEPGDLVQKSDQNQGSYGLKYERVDPSEDGTAIRRTGRVYELMRRKGVDPSILEADREQLSISIGAYTVELTPQQIQREDSSGEVTIYRPEHEIVIMQNADLAMYLAKGDPPEDPEALDLRPLLSQWNSGANAGGNCSAMDHGRNRFVYIDDRMRAAIREHEKAQREAELSNL